MDDYSSTSEGDYLKRLVSESRFRESSISWAESSLFTSGDAAGCRLKQVARNGYGFLEACDSIADERGRRHGNLYNSIDGERDAENARLSWTRAPAPHAYLT